MSENKQPLKIQIASTCLQVVSDHPRETQGGIVSVRCKGPGSKNADGQTYSALWVEVVAKGDLGALLANAHKGDRIDVGGELRAGRDYTSRDGEQRKGGPVIWAASLRFVGDKVSREPAADVGDDDGIPF